MTARIIVQTGISAGNVYWIDKPVIRVGSDPNLDLSIPNSELELHILTIEYRAGDYRVYNRSTQPVFLGENLVSPGQTLKWAETDLLELPSGDQLAIELDDDPSPGPQPLVVADLKGYSQGESEAKSAQTCSELCDSTTTSPTWPAKQTSASPVSAAHDLTTSSSRSNGAMWQLAVIGICLALGSLLLVRHQLKTFSANESTLPVFEQLIRHAQSADNELPNGLIARLQYAEAAVVADNRPEAQERYRKLRDTLMAWKLGATKPGSSQPSDLQQEVCQLVEHRLRELSTSDRLP